MLPGFLVIKLDTADLMDIERTAFVGTALLLVLLLSEALALSHDQILMSLITPTMCVKGIRR